MVIAFVEMSIHFAAENAAVFVSCFVIWLEFPTKSWR